jgi:uncharacterized protein
MNNLVPLPQIDIQKPEEKTWGMICHLAAFGMYVFPAFGNIIGAAIAWIVFKDRSEFANDQGKESLNFQLSLTLYAFVAFIFAFVTFGVGLILVIPVLGIMALFQIILVIVAALEANKGVVYRYPMTIRFVQ